LFRPVYDSSGGNDGFVSIEVSPLIAHDTKATVTMAKELWKRIDRPNLMVKIPGTNEGVPAIEECVAEGININVTLIFAIEMYEKTARAYVRGLQRRVKKGLPIDHQTSVNSVFVSRIDTLIDKLLQARIDKGETQLESLLGKTGVANLKLTYQKYLEIFESEEWAPLKAKGASEQRPLWASTSTKNPKYADLMYVEPVVAHNTVNTMPPQTLDALLDHGKIVPDTILQDVDGARDTLKRLAESGISRPEDVAVLLDAVAEYEVVDDGRELAITLLRATGLISRDANPWRADPAGPMLPTPSAQRIGRVEASFALLPHLGAPGAHPGAESGGKNNRGKSRRRSNLDHTRGSENTGESGDK